MKKAPQRKPCLHWIDDDLDIDGGSVSANFKPSLERAGFDCTFSTPDTLLCGDGTAVLLLKAEIEKGHLRVLVLDWQDGGNDELYGYLRESLIKAEARVILKSIYGPALLAAHGVYQRFPELAAYSYWREDGQDALLDLLPNTHSIAQATAPAEFPFDPLSLVNQLPIRLLKLSRIPSEGEGLIDVVTECWRSDSWTLDSSKELPDAPDCPEPQFGLETQLLQGKDPRPPHGDGPMLESKWAAPSLESGEWLVWQMRQALPAGSMTNPYRSPQDCLDLILTLAEQAGLTRGRYYQITQIDGLQRPLLELTHCRPKAKKPLPVAAEMDYGEEDLFAEFSKLRDPTLPGRKTLVQRTRSMRDFSGGPNDVAVWSTVIPEPEAPLDESWLVPVFRQTEAANTDLSLAQVQGIFIFDLGGPGAIPERATKNLASPILNALMDFSVNRPGF